MKICSLVQTLHFSSKIRLGIFYDHFYAEFGTEASLNNRKTSKIL